MQVSFFNRGPHEPPMKMHFLDQVPAVGETVMLVEIEGRPMTKYRVEGVEWIPGHNAANVDIRPVTPFG